MSPRDDAAWAAIDRKTAELGLDKLPKWQRDRVVKLAWDLGHAHGVDEVLIHLDDLADLFKPPELALVTILRVDASCAQAREWATTVAVDQGWLDLKWEVGDDESRLFGWRP